MAGLSTNAPGLWGGFAGLLYGSTSLSTPPGLLADATPAWVLPGAALDLDFADSLGYNSRNLATTTPDSILTYTNPSAKMVYGSDGVLGYAAHNLLLQSQTFETASWTKGDTTITANAVAAPDGTTTADKLVEAATLASHFAFQTTLSSVTSGTTYTQTVYAKAAERTWLRIFLGANIGNGLAWINLATGAVGTTSGSPTVAVTDAGGGWYRIAVSKAATGTGTTSISFLLGTGDGVDTYTGDGTSGIYIWGAQLNLGSSALTYIPTTTAAVYSLPIDHNPTTLAPLGVLIEEQRTNLLQWSEQFNDAAWAKAQATVTANSAIAPDGTTTADTLLDTAVSNIHYISQTVTGSPSGVTYTVSAYLKASTLSYATIGLSDISSGSLYAVAVFNLSSGAVATSGAAGAGYSVTSSSITSVGNGWYRCVATVVAGTSVAFLKTVVGCNKTGVITGSAGGFESYLGNGSGIYLWGAQLEAGAFPTSYVPTVASQSTRAADQVSILTSAFAYNAAAGSIAVSAANQTPVSTEYIWQLYLNGPNNLYLRRRDGTNKQQVVLTVSSIAEVLFNDTTERYGGNVVSNAVAFAEDDFAWSVDGGAVFTDTATSPLPAFTTLQIGTSSVTSQFNGHIKRLTYFPTRKSNAELQALAA